MSEGTNAYDASQIEVLEGAEAIRKRPGMYIGSTSERGLCQLVFEAADRAVNEVLAGRASLVDITLLPGLGVKVADDGPGVSDLEALLTQIQDWTRALGRHDVTIGFVGVGPFVVNALSSRLTAEVRREGTRWTQEYARGKAVTPLINTGASPGHGTTLTFWADAEIFESVDYPFDKLADRFRELALLNRDLEIHLTDRRVPDAPRSAQFRYSAGARDFVAFLDEQDEDLVDAQITGFEREEPLMAGTVQVALRWRASGEERIRSFANSRPTLCGTHERGFRDGLAAAVTTYAREHQLLLSTDPDIDPDHIGEGLTAVVSVKLDAPEFEGATRGVLGNAAAHTCVEQAVREHVNRWLDDHPEAAATVVDRILRSTRRT
ncbi:DNA gyrase subunit B [Streptomyces sp. NBC_01465]|uniref:DNA gyrase subunit B n=1 Tax=Streptomyces sp. NBC_01465 TaxID=2903878 RepID=UPI002E2F9EEE|nr:DNA gyrase subunit B [Streptomyces sp. NBC_01465]